MFENAHLPSSKRRPHGIRTSLTRAISTILRAGFYCRVSTQSQATEDKVSFDVQEAECRIRAAFLAAREGKELLVVRVWKEDISGTTRWQERAGLSEAVAYAKEGQLDYLIAYRVDRYSRDREGIEAFLVYREINPYGVRMAVCDLDLRYDLKTSEMEHDSLMLLCIYGQQAGRERSQILQRTEDGRRKKAEKGKQTSRSFFPFGYRVYRYEDVYTGACLRDEVGVYAIIEEQAVVVRWIFELVAAGNSRHKVCHLLQEKKILTPRGVASWSLSTITHIIRQPIYKGLASYGKTNSRHNPERVKEGLGEKYAVRAAPEDVIYIPCPPVVSPELWQAANDALDRNPSFLSGRSDTRFLLSGFLVCPLCGYAMTGRRRGRERTGQYYLCGKRCRDYSRAAHDTTPRCDFPYIRADVSESQVATAILSAIQREKYLSAALTRFQEEVRKTAQTGAGVLDSQKESLLRRRAAAFKAHEAAQTAILRTLELDPTADVTRFVLKAKSNRADWEYLDRQLATLDTPTVPPALLELAHMDANAIASYACGMLSRLAEAFDSPVMSIIEKRFLLDAVVDSMRPTMPEGGKRGHAPGVPGIEVKLRDTLLHSAMESVSKMTVSVPDSRSKRTSRTPAHRRSRRPDG